MRNSRANSAAFLTAVFAVAATAIVLRVSLPANLLNLFMEYTTDKGSFIQKLHPGTYAIVAAAIIVPLTLRAYVDAWTLRSIRAMALFTVAVVLLIAYLIVAGHFGSAGYLIDTYIAATLGGITLLLLPPDMRARTADLVLFVLIVSAIIGIFEFVTHIRLIPYPIEEHEFRPTGLLDHPLLLGLLCSTAIPFVAASDWQRSMRIAAICILFLGVAAASARIAMLAASLATAVVILAAPIRTASSSQSARLKALMIVAGAILLAAAITVLAFSGFLDRFSRGLTDASAMARIRIYDIFGLVSWTEILFGMPAEDIAKLVKRLDLMVLESSPVAWILHFGLFAAIGFVAAFLGMLRTLLRGARPLVVFGSLLFLAVALTNNTLSTKTPAVLVLIVLIIGTAARHIRTPLR
ncbi:MAG: VpsF family polysaccharide biosynthesis protein [Rhodobiaceae bacterium]|nr:VpsF family polysaccharide biosynthesis protein [Rhodobiaceae bacterium]